MPRKRDVSLDGYGISKMRYRELKYFCLQYPEKKQKLSRLLGIGTIANDGLSKENKPSDPTSTTAIKIAKLEDDIETIKQAAFEAAPGMHEQLIKNVTEDIPYEYMDVPCGRRQFYTCRRKFFYLLSKKG